MSDDLYKAPAFQFYPDDFIADTADFTAEELGIYMRFLCHQWKQGAIPADLVRQSIIGRTDQRRMKLVWATIYSKYEPHPDIDGFLVQPRLERVRQEAAEHSRIQSERGKAGANKRWHKHSTSIGASNTQAMLDGMLTDGSPVSNSYPTPSVDKSTSVVGSARPEKSNPDTSWVEPLRESARAIAGKPIQSLTRDERQILARYHCLEFSNCTKTEANNKARATQVAAAFASMGRSKHYGDMTVREYVGYARKVHEQREKTPWFDPWLIRAVVEWEE